MRTASAILLTTLICINLFGVYTMFMFRQADIKEEMNASISKSQSSDYHETLTFSKADFEQLSFNDHGRELRLNGKLYDVVGINNTGSQVQVIVEFDSKETSLVDAFSNLMSQQQDKDQNSSPLKTIISHFQQDYIAGRAYSHSFEHAFITGYFLVMCVYPYSSFQADNLTPPPQFSLV